MTVQSEVSRLSYAGDGSTVTFSVTFYFLVEADLLVVVRAADDTETVQVLGSDYTVSGAGNSNGGSITFVAAPAIGETIAIVRAPAPTQLTNYNNQDPFPADSHERGLDKLTMLVQRIEDQLGRAILFGETSGLSAIALPDPVANKYIRWNDAGTALELASSSTEVAVADLTDISADGVSLITAADFDAMLTLLGGISELSDDTTPQLGGDLDTQGYDILAPGNLPVTFATRALLQAEEGADYPTIYLTEAGRGGLFKWDGSDLSTEVAADTAEGHFIAPDSDSDGSSGAWVRVDRSRYLPRHFGAAANGTTDDSAAISAMLDLIIQQGEGKVYVEGRVRLASQVSKTTLPDYFALAIEGPGASVGGFAVDNTSGGISLSSASLRTISVELRNFYMDPAQDGSGDGFVLSLPEGGLQARHMAIVENVNFVPLNYTTAGTFDDPLSLTGLYRPRVAGCVFDQGTSATTKQGTILNLDGSYKPHIYDNYLNGPATYGCKHTSTGSEGLFFCFNSVNGPDYGLYQTDTTGREPEVYVEMNHFNCDVASIYIDGVKYFWIRDNLLYMQNGITSFDDILVINANGGLIADNIYRQPGGTDRRHINMSETGVIRDIVVQETAASFQAETSDPPIYIGDGVDNITLELPERLTADGYDSASYPDAIYEVHSGATNIYLETPAGNKRINSGAIDGQRPRPLVFAGIVAAHTGTTSVTTIKTVTIPGGAMGPNGFVRISTSYSNTPNANNKQLVGYFGGTGGILIDNRTVTTTGYSTKNFMIRNRGSESSQIATQANINSVEGTVAGAATGTVDTSADVDIVFRVNLSDAGDTVTLEHYVVEVFYVD